MTGAGADVWLPDPVTETGESPVSGIRLSAADTRGEETELEEGTVYETGRFSEGAAGTFVISRETMSELYNGMTLTGDPLDGKTVLLVPSGNPSLVLMPENGGTEGKTKTVFSERTGDKGSEAQQWVVSKVQEGTYRLQNRASGLMLHTVSGQTGAGTGTDIISAGSEDQSVQWTAGR